MHLTRFQMYRRLAEFLGPRQKSGHILCVSGGQHILPLFDLSRSRVTETRYEQVDLQALPFAGGVFDHVVTDQVIEHVANPAIAIRESYRVLKPGGYAIHTTCLLNPVHPSPEDFWRFTPSGLSRLCREFREIVQCEGWGNRVALGLVLAGFRRLSIPESRHHPLHKLATWNEANYPIVTWIVARK